MPSSSAAQHRWIGWLHSDPAAREKSGMSKAKVDEWLHADKGSPWKKRDDGGGITAGASDGIGGPAPSAQTMNPLSQNAQQHYQGMSTEQLAELAARLGPSQQGQLAQKVLMQKRMQPTQQLAGGGAMGISGSEASPWWTRSEARGADSGFLHGTTPGRADSVNTTAPGGAYVLPADVVAGLGEGNSLAGARVADAMFSTGPHGTPLPRGGGHRGMPSPPPAFREQAQNGGAIRLFKGGVADGQKVLLSDGEYIVSPAFCEKLGTIKHKGKVVDEGAKVRRKRGHGLLDRWVIEKRAEIIKDMKKLPGPVKT